MQEELPGLIYAYTLDGRGGGSPMGWDGIRQGGTGGLQWLHLRYTDETVQSWLLKESGLPEIICNALIDEDVRPRMLAYGEGLLLVLRSVNCNPGSDPEDMVALRMWVEPGRIITMRHRKVMAIEDINAALLSGKGPKTVSGFVVMICDLITDRINEEVSQLVDRSDELEDSVIEMEGQELRGELTALRRQAIALRRYIAPQRDVLSKLYLQHLEWAEIDFSLLIREQNEATIRLLEDLDSARERAAITHEEINSRMAEKMNKTMYLLAVVAAIFLPLSFVTGLLGINVGGIPGTDSKWAFLIVCSILAVIAGLQFLYFKYRSLL